MNSNLIKFALSALVIGLFLTFNQTINAQSALDGFDPNANGTVRAVVVQPDGKILLGGSFTTLSPNGGAAVTRNRIARVNADGTLDTTFNPNASNTVLSIAVQSDGKILLGGGFTTLSPNGGAAVTRNRIARVNADGTLDAAFNPNANGTVFSIAVQSDGKILLGGSLSTLSPNGGAAVMRSGIARVNADGTLDTAFNPNANAGVNSIAVQSDGKILVGGFFNNANSIGGQTRNRIARLDATTGLADSFDPNANGSVFSIAVQSDGKILAGGNFTTIGGQSRNIFARLTNDTAALSTLFVSRTNLILSRDGSAPQFTRVVFEQSINNGATWTTLGTAINSFVSTGGDSGGNASVNERASKPANNPLAPQAAGYTLTGQSIPTGQNVLIRARGYYRSGYLSGSETIEDKVRNVFLLTVSAANVSISGRVLTSSGAGVRNAIVQLTGTDGVTRRARTSSFGYYRFDDVEAGETYVIGVASKRYTFAPRAITVADELTDVDFIGQ